MLILCLHFSVDENMYYRSIHKEDTSPARRDQTHGIVNSLLPSPSISTSEESDPSPNASNVQSEVNEEEGSGKGEPPGIGKDLPQPPFLFRDAKGLLGMTRSHNVSQTSLYSIQSQSMLTNLGGFSSLLLSCKLTSPLNSSH